MTIGIETRKYKKKRRNNLIFLLQENCRIKTSKVILNLVDVKCIKLIKINDKNASLTFPFKVKGRKIFMNVKMSLEAVEPGSFSDSINLQFVAKI